MTALLVQTVLLICLVKVMATGEGKLEAVEISPQGTVTDHQGDLNDDGYQIAEQGESAVDDGAR